jgi:hypothetical protein
MDGLHHQAERGGACAGESVLPDATCKKNTIGTFGPKITHVTPHHEKNCNTGSASSLGDFLFFWGCNIFVRTADYFAVNTHDLSAKPLLIYLH